MTSYSNSNRGGQFRTSPLMTAYQFVFFTFYQIMQKVSFDRFIAYKAALLVCALQAWLVILGVSLLKLLVHTTYVVPLWAWVTMGLPISMVVYVVVYERGPWKEYVEYFEQLPKRKLVIGRLFVLVTVLGLFTMIMLVGAPPSQPPH